jgi:hypothetical protein
MEEKKEKRVLKVELEDEVKKVSITGLGEDDKVVMMQELSEDDLDEATGGTVPVPPSCRVFHHCVNLAAPREPGVSIP